MDVKSLSVDEILFLAAVRNAPPEVRRSLGLRLKTSAVSKNLSFSAKVKLELKRLSLTQVSVIAALGLDGPVFKSAMRNQSGVSIDLLSSLSGLGFDVHFLTTGSYQSGGLGSAAIHYSVLEAVELLSFDKKINGKQLANAVDKISAKYVRTGGVLPVVGLFDRVKTGVIRVYKFDGKEFIGQSSGVVVGDGKYVLTCFHSINDCDSVAVHPYDKNDAIFGKVIYQDAANDLAIIGLDEVIGEPIPLDWDMESLTGDGVVIIGFPLASTEASLVSAHIAGQAGCQIRIDAIVNRGNSGSPVLNLKGEVIGIVRVKYSSLPEILDEIDAITEKPLAEIELNERLAKLQSLSSEVRQNLVFGMAEATSISALISSIGNQELKKMIHNTVFHAQ